MQSFNFYYIEYYRLEDQAPQRAYIIYIEIYSTYNSGIIAAFLHCSIGRSSGHVEGGISTPAGRTRQAKHMLEAVLQ